MGYKISLPDRAVIRQSSGDDPGMSGAAVTMPSALLAVAEFGRRTASWSEWDGGALKTPKGKIIDPA
jgi:hypothetical protein